MPLLSKTKRFLFGYDIFISYSRKDSLDYAYAIASHFMKRGYECYIDQLSSITPGQELPPGIKDAVKRSTSFVLIGSEGAQTSDPIEKEIMLFLENNKNKPLIPVTVAGAINPRARWFEKITGLAMIDDTGENLKAGSPDKDVLERIENALKFTKKSARLRTVALSIVLVVAAIIGIAAFYVREKGKEAIAADMNRQLSDLYVSGNDHMAASDFSAAYASYMQCYDQEKKRQLTTSRSKFLLSKTMNDGLSKEIKLSETVVDIWDLYQAGDNLFVLTRNYPVSEDYSYADHEYQSLVAIDLNNYNKQDSVTGQFDAITYDDAGNSLIDARLTDETLLFEWRNKKLKVEKQIDFGKILGTDSEIQLDRVDGILFFARDNILAIRMIVNLERDEIPVTCFLDVNNNKFVYPGQHLLDNPKIVEWIFKSKYILDNNDLGRCTPTEKLVRGRRGEDYGDGKLLSEVQYDTDIVVNGRGSLALVTVESGKRDIFINEKGVWRQIKSIPFSASAEFFLDDYAVAYLSNTRTVGLYDLKPVLEGKSPPKPAEDFSVRRPMNIYDAQMNASRFLPQLNSLVTCHADGSINIYSVVSGRMMTLKDAKNWVSDVYTNSSGNVLYSVGREPCIRVWNSNIDKLNSVVPAREKSPTDFYGNGGIEDLRYGHNVHKDNYYTRLVQNSKSEGCDVVVAGPTGKIKSFAFPILKRTLGTCYINGPWCYFARDRRYPEMDTCNFINIVNGEKRALVLPKNTLINEYSIATDGSWVESIRDQTLTIRTARDGFITTKWAGGIFSKTGKSYANFINDSLFVWDLTQPGKYPLYISLDKEYAWEDLWLANSIMTVRISDDDRCIMIRGAIRYAIHSLADGREIPVPKDILAKIDLSYGRRDLSDLDFSHNGDKVVFSLKERIYLYDYSLQQTFILYKQHGYYTNVKFAEHEDWVISATAASDVITFWNYKENIKFEYRTGSSDGDEIGDLINNFRLVDNGSVLLFSTNDGYMKITSPACHDSDFDKRIGLYQSKNY